MRLTALMIVLALTAGFVAGCGCDRQRPAGKSSPPVEGTTLALLPADNEVKGWVLTSPASRYVGHELYEPIDGAADAFFQFAFKEAAFALYRSNGNQVQVRIYEMGSPDDAYGIARNNDDVNCEFMPLGADGRATITDGWLHFAKGPYFVVLERGMYGEPGDVRKGIDELAAAIETKIDAAFHTPEVFGSLPDDHVPGSVRFFRTPMTQGNIFYITDENVLGLRNDTLGAAACYDTITTEAGTKAGRNALFVVTYPSPEEAPRLFREAGRIFSQEPFQVFGALTDSDALLTVHKDGRLFLKLGCTDGALYGAWDIEDEARVDALLAELAKRINETKGSEDKP